MAGIAENEGYEEVYDMIGDILESATGNHRDILVKLSEAYKIPYSQEPDYNEEQYREAYLYLYSPMFSFATSKILNKFTKNLQDQLAGKEALNVCCIGGGPATELLVLIKVLERLGICPSSVNCTVLDKFPAWKETWDKLWARRRFMGERVVDVSMAYVGCDSSQDISEEAQSAIQGADVVTVFMAYSRSAAAAAILGHMKDNSTLLYMDNVCFDKEQTMKNEFLQSLSGFRTLSSVERELYDSREGRRYTDYPGMYSFWTSCHYSQMADVTVSALILSKEAANGDGDGDGDGDVDEDVISQSLSAMKVK